MRFVPVDVGVRRSAPELPGVRRSGCELVGGDELVLESIEYERER